MNIFFITSLIISGYVVVTTRSQSSCASTGTHIGALTSSGGSVSSVQCNAQNLTIFFESSFYSHSCAAGKNFTVKSPISTCSDSPYPISTGQLHFDINNCLVAKSNLTEELLFQVEFEVSDSYEHVVNGLVIDQGTSYSSWTINCTFDRVKEVEVNQSVYFTPVIEQFDKEVEADFEIQMLAYDYYKQCEKRGKSENCEK